MLHNNYLISCNLEHQCGRYLITRRRSGEVMLWSGVSVGRRKLGVESAVVWRKRIMFIYNLKLGTRQRSVWFTDFPGVGWRMCNPGAPLIDFGLGPPPLGRLRQSFRPRHVGCCRGLRFRVSPFSLFVLDRVVGIGAPPIRGCCLVTNCGPPDLMSVFNLKHESRCRSLSVDLWEPGNPKPILIQYVLVLLTIISVSLSF